MRQVLKSASSGMGRRGRSTQKKAISRSMVSRQCSSRPTEWWWQRWSEPHPSVSFHCGVSGRAVLVVVRGPGLGPSAWFFHGFRLSLRQELTAAGLQNDEYPCCSVLTLVGRLSVCLKPEAGGEEHPAKMHRILFSVQILCSLARIFGRSLFCL